MIFQALPLTTPFFERDVTLVARDLLGRLVVRRTADGLCVGRIVESEAYLAAGDTASHSFRGKTKKNASMFGPPGRAYVYSIHSRYCLNVVTEQPRTASAVLIRALEPLAGIAVMQQRRGRQNLLDLCRGPARLCEALAIDRRLDGWNLMRGERLWIADDATSRPPQPIATSTRIGVTSAHEAELRFFLPGNSFVSGPRRLARSTIQTT